MVVCVLEVEPVDSVTTCVSFIQVASRLAGSDMVGRQTQDALATFLGLQLERGFDHGRDKPAVHVPFNVAVEEPHARVVGAEAENSVTRGMNEDRISTHGDLGKREVCRVVEASVVVGPSDYLEVVCVQVERMLSGVIIVDHQLDDLAVVEHEGITVDAVDAGVGDDVCRSGESSVESGHLLRDIGDVVEKRTEQPMWLVRTLIIPCDRGWITH